MINLRGVVVVVLALLALASVASASRDTTPERTVYFDCAEVRLYVETYGMAAVIVVARARGVSEKVIFETARRCLR